MVDFALDGGFFGAERPVQARMWCAACRSHTPHVLEQSSTGEDGGTPRREWACRLCGLAAQRLPGAPAAVDAPAGEVLGPGAPPWWAAWAEPYLQDARLSAGYFLLGLLAFGPVSARLVRACSTWAGLSWWSVRAAKGALRVESRRVGRRWLWFPPW